MVSLFVWSFPIKFSFQTPDGSRCTYHCISRLLIVVIMMIRTLYSDVKKTNIDIKM